MLTLDQKIRKWSRTVNRNKTFTPIEMEEMEDHLLLEIKQMVQYDKLTEEEAFKKATETLGEQGILDEEYGKIRWSAFFKVKLWAYLQTFIILGLVLFLVVPNIHFPEKNRNGYIVGKEIGEISRWAYDGSKNSPDSYITCKNKTYFYSEEQKNLLCYQYSPHDFNGVSLFLASPYFASTPYCSCLSPFEINSNNDFYMLEDYDKSITVYRDAKKIKSIKLSENLSFDRIEGFKVIGTKLIVCFTESETKKLETEKVYEEIDVYSSLFIYDLLSNRPKWETIKLKNVVLSMDRSEDELAILNINGQIDVYAFQNQKLTMIDTRKINDFSEFLANHRTKPKDSFQAKMSTKFLNFKNSLSSYMAKIKTWKIFGKHPKPASFFAKKLHIADKDVINAEIWSDKTPWKKTFVKIDDNSWFVYFDDKGQIWFDRIEDIQVTFNPIQKNLSTSIMDHTFSNCHISLLFSKKNHQLVLVENINRFSYLVPNGKQLQILPLTDKDIAGVMKVNFIDPERLVLVKYPKGNLPSEPLALYLFKD